MECRFLYYYFPHLSSRLFLFHSQNFSVVSFSFLLFTSSSLVPFSWSQVPDVVVVVCISSLFRRSGEQREWITKKKLNKIEKCPRIFKFQTTLSVEQQRSIRWYQLELTQNFIKKLWGSTEIWIKWGKKISIDFQEFHATTRSSHRQPDRTADQAFFAFSSDFHSLISCSFFFAWASSALPTAVWRCCIECWSFLARITHQHQTTHKICVRHTRFSNSLIAFLVATRLARVHILLIVSTEPATLNTCAGSITISQSTIRDFCRFYETLKSFCYR